MFNTSEKIENLNFEKYLTLQKLFMSPGFDPNNIIELDLSNEIHADIPPGKPLWFLKNLKILILSKNNIANFSAKTLVKYTPKLEKLDLSYNNIKTLDDIIELGFLQNLESLNIKENPISKNLLRIKLIENLLFPEKYKPYNPVKILTATYEHVPKSSDQTLQRQKSREKFNRAIDGDGIADEKNSNSRPKWEKKTPINYSLIPCPVPRKTKFPMLVYLNEEIISKQDLFSILMVDDLSEIFIMKNESSHQCASNNNDNNTNGRSSHSSSTIQKSHRETNEKYIEKYCKRVLKKNNRSMSEDKNPSKLLLTNDDKEYMKNLSNQEKQNYIYRQIQCEKGSNIWHKPWDIKYKNHLSTISIKDYKLMLSDYQNVKLKKIQKEELIKQELMERKFYNQINKNKGKSKSQSQSKMKTNIVNINQSLLLKGDDNINKYNNKSNQEIDNLFNIKKKVFKKKLRPTHLLNNMLYNENSSESSLSEKHSDNSDNDLNENQEQSNAQDLSIPSIQNKSPSSGHSPKLKKLERYKSISVKFDKNKDYANNTSYEQDLLNINKVENDISPIKPQIVEEEDDNNNNNNDDNNNNNKNGNNIPNQQKQVNELGLTRIIKREESSPNIALPIYGSSHKQTNNTKEDKRVNDTCSQIVVKNLDHAFKFYIKDNMLKNDSKIISETPPDNKTLSEKNKPSNFPGKKPSETMDSGIMLKSKETNLCIKSGLTIGNNAEEENPKNQDNFNFVGLPVSINNSDNNPNKKTEEIESENNIISLNQSIHPHLDIKKDDICNKIDKDIIPEVADTVIISDSNDQKDLTPRQSITILNNNLIESAHHINPPRQNRREHILKNRVNKIRQDERKSFSIKNKLFYNKDRTSQIPLEQNATVDLNHSKTFSGTKEIKNRPLTGFQSTSNLSKSITQDSKEILGKTGSNGTNRAATARHSRKISLLSQKKIGDLSMIKSQFKETSKVTIDGDIDVNKNTVRSTMKLEDLIPNEKEGVKDNIKLKILNDRDEKYNRLVKVAKSLETSKQIRSVSELLNKKINIVTKKQKIKAPTKIFDYETVVDFLLEKSGKDKMSYNEVLVAKEILNQLNENSKEDHITNDHKNSKLTLGFLENELKSMNELQTFNLNREEEERRKQYIFDLYEQIDAFENVELRRKNFKNSNLLKKVEKKEIERAENNAVLAAYVLRLKKYYGNDYIKRYFKDIANVDIFDNQSNLNLGAEPKSHIELSNPEPTKNHKDLYGHLKELYKLKRAAPYAGETEPRPGVDMPKLKKINVKDLPGIEEMTEHHIRKLYDRFNNNEKRGLSTEEKMIRYAQELKDNAQKNELLNERVNKHITEIRNNINEFCKQQIIENDMRHDKVACFKRFVKLMRENKL